ncbi:MAG TPA: hypothetical protein VFI92_02125 [Steroidobacteraceae bacterium]|nr:hypothetical protein [Steroidobacteraceae bacterium]
MPASDASVVIDVVNGRIVCDPATSVYHGRRATWSRAANATFSFRLRFTPKSGSSPWPFTGPKPADNWTDMKPSFSGVIAAKEDDAFKYDVEVDIAGVNSYDPMIIVGRG